MTATVRLIAGLKPIDGNARRVVSHGVHFTSHLDEKQTRAVWLEKPPTAPLPRHYMDLVGITIDRLTVAGYGGKDRHRNRCWICRCTCGRFMFLRDETIFKGLDGLLKEPLMCRECNHVFYTLQPNRYGNLRKRHVEMEKAE